MLSTTQGLLVGSNHDVKLVDDHVVDVIFSGQGSAFALGGSLRSPDSFLASVGQNIVLLHAHAQPRVLVQNLPDLAQTLAEDRSGALWLGTTTRGILMAKPQSDSPVEAVATGPAEGLPGSAFRSSVLGAPDGTVLAFSTLGGWIKGRDAKRFEPIAAYPQRGSPALSNVDANGAAWAVLPASDGRPACLGRIAIKGDHAVWEPESVEGLWNVGMPRTLFAENSESGATVLWIGGTNGILRTSVAAGAVATPPRAPLLHAFARAAGSRTPQPINGALSYSTRSISFEFAAPEFSRRAALRLETRIDGVDADWVPANATSRRELTAVRDGSYVFRVRAVAETGAVSEASVFAFTVTPPWWRTAPAILGAIIALLPVLYGAYRLRIRAFRRRNADLEAKVRQRTEELARASAAKTQFVANMSHDIRNPLNGIVGLTLALEDSPLDARQSEIVATLRECTAYLSTLVDDVLDFASIEAGRIELRPAPFVPAELLRSVAAALRARLPVSGATLVIEPGPDLPSAVLGDAGRIQQILVNYVTNALKYAGGTIRLGATVRVEDREEVEFAVADDGPGLTGAERAVLFTKFTRLAKVGGENVEGTGLGLASCRLLADAMGGSVGVDSSPGHGARFYLRLPLAVAPPPAEVPASSLPQASVLIVEDTDYNAVAATAVLAKLGLASERARNGHEALRLFADRRFNIVLLDRNLPDMDGTEVARRIRELEGGSPQSILLAVTAYCTAEDRTLCLNAGMDAFVGKPLTPEKLRKVLIDAGRKLLSAASVQVPPGPQDEAIDLSLLGYISDGTAQGLTVQIERFLAALSEARAQVARAVDNRDLAALADAAHQVLSHAKLIGRKPLEAAALHLEKTARASDAAAFDDPLRRVRSEADALTAALHCRLRAKQSA